MNDSREKRHAIDMSALGRSNAGLSLDNEEIAINVNSLKLFYGDKQAINGVDMQIPKNRVTAFIGPSGCGKSTLLRCFNRMNDLIDGCRVEGEVTIEGENIYDKGVNVSIYENVAYGLRLQGIKDRRVLDEVIERSLKGAALWDEVKDRLNDSGMGLSGGQQQRLVIARAIAVEPDVLLLDEPASALDPISTLKLEELIYELKNKYTIVIVTHNMQQAARVSDYTAFMFMGDQVEFSDTDTLFTNPREKRTEDYITGRYG